MINGAHVVIASSSAEADRVFFRDVLKFPVADTGGYLIFGLPPSELSFHDSPEEGRHHELYLLCDDIDSFVETMQAADVTCGPIQDQGWGIIVQITLPSGAPLHVYEPRHERPV